MQHRKTGQAQGSCPICKGALSLQATQNDFTPIYMAGSQAEEEKYAGGTDDCIPPRPSAARRQHKAEPSPQSHESPEEHVPYRQEIDENFAFLFPSETFSVPMIQAVHNFDAPVAQGASDYSPFLQAVQEDDQHMTQLAQGSTDDVQSAHYSPILYAHDMAQLARGRTEEVQSYLQEEGASNRHEITESLSEASNYNQHFQYNEGRTSTELPLQYAGRGVTHEQFIVHHVQLISPICIVPFQPTSSTPPP